MRKRGKGNVMRKVQEFDDGKQGIQEIAWKSAGEEEFAPWPAWMRGVQPQAASKRLHIPWQEQGFEVPIRRETAWNATGEARDSRRP